MVLCPIICGFFLCIILFVIFALFLLIVAPVVAKYTLHYPQPHT